jgi:aminomethyltransferase
MSDELSGADSLLHSPVHEAHLALGATMGAFGGWEMPISYAGGGVVAEHIAVRTAVGIFDVSHLGKADVTGPGAAQFVNRCLTADLDRIGPGRAQYTMCCNDSGGVIDDLIAYLVADDEVFVVPNAANAAEVVAVLQAAAPEGVQIHDRHGEFGVLAVQGPLAAEVVAAVGLPTELDYMAWADGIWDAADGTTATVRVCRTGYSGELGFELLPPWGAARELWDRLLTEAASRGGRPAGLGARDTLRTEMGYPLHGQDLGPDITPVQARAGWAVGWQKPAFFGRAALLAERAAGARRSLRGLEALDRGVLRPHLRVMSAAGAAIGETTSGTFSPTLGKGIGLALLDSAAGVEDGDEITVDVRGRLLRVRVVRPPFVPSHVK